MNKVTSPESQELEILQKKVKSDESISNISRHYEENNDANTPPYTTSSKTIHIMPIQTEPFAVHANSNLLKRKALEQSLFAAKPKYEAISYLPNNIKEIKEEHIVFKYSGLSTLGSKSFLYCHEDQL